MVRKGLGLLRIVAPVFQAPVGFTSSILLRRRLLRQMAFTVRDDATHMRYILCLSISGLYIRFSHPV
jgi:hypothetical protein